MIIKKNKNGGYMENLIKKAKKVGLITFEKVLKILGMMFLGLFLFFRGMFGGVLSFFIGLIFLYFFLGFTGVILCHVFSTLCHVYLRH